MASPITSKSLAELQKVLDGFIPRKLQGEHKEKFISAWNGEDLYYDDEDLLYSNVTILLAHLMLKKGKKVLFLVPSVIVAHQIENYLYEGSTKMEERLHAFVPVFSGFEADKFDVIVLYALDPKIYKEKIKSKRPLQWIIQPLEKIRPSHLILSSCCQDDD